MPVTLEEYKERLAAKLVAEAPTLDEFRERWIVPRSGASWSARCRRRPCSPLVRTLEQMSDYDLYDVLAELGYGLAPRTRTSAPTHSATSTKVARPACRRDSRRRSRPSPRSSRKPVPRG